MLWKKKDIQKLGKEFEKELNKIYFDLGSDTLDRSRDLCPKGKTRTLVNSSSIQHTKDGWSIVYEAPYASDIHDGSEAQARGERNYVMNVKTHKRRLASGKVTSVRNHKKQYHNYQKPTLINNDWRIVAPSGGNEPIPFLSKAWDEVRGKVKDKALKKILPTELSKTPL